MKNTQKGFVIPLIIIAVLVIGGGVYLYTKNNKVVTTSTPVTNTTPVKTTKTIPAYEFSSTTPNKLTAVKLSHHSLSINSPWGIEKSYKGNATQDDFLGMYTFSSGNRVTIALDKLSPREGLKELDLSSEGQIEYDSAFAFIESKIDVDDSSYEFQKLILETDQNSIDSATNASDQEGYAKVLIFRNNMIFSGETVYQFTTPNGRGFVYIPKDSTLTNHVDFWGTNGWKYSFLFPKQTLTKEDIDAFIKSIKTL